jgi:hypothetical protein
MTFEVVAELEEEARRLRSTGQIPPGFEAELSASFEAAAEVSLAAAEQPRRTAASLLGYGDPGGARRSQGERLADVRARVSSVARRRLGPPARRLERRSELGAARAAEALSTQAHVALDHLERVASRSPVVSRTLAAVRPGGGDASAVGTLTPAIEGPLLAWVLERLADSAATEEAEAAPGLVLHVECGDGRVVEALAARGLDARGADPRRSARSSGGTNILAAGALECLGATPNDTLDGLLITGVVDRLRPGAARALAQLASVRLAPGGVLVVVSARPEVAFAIDPVAADLAAGRPLHPVTWCHLLARYGLSDLAVYDPDPSEPDVFAVSARRPVVAWMSGEDAR